MNNQYVRNQYYCPICNNPIIFIHQYRRWWCGRCNKYPFVNPRYGPHQPIQHKSIQSNKTDQHQIPVQPSHFFICPVCKNDLSFINKYSRWWCGRCARYTQPEVVQNPNTSLEYRRTGQWISSSIFNNNRHPRIRIQSSFGTSEKKEHPSRLTATHNFDGTFNYHEFRVRGDRVYDQHSGLPLYRISGDRLYKTIHHPNGPGGPAVFRIDGDRLRPTFGSSSDSFRISSSSSRSSRRSGLGSSNFSSSSSDDDSKSGSKFYSGFKSSFDRNDEKENDDKFGKRSSRSSDSFLSSFREREEKRRNEFFSALRGKKTSDKSSDNNDD